jgi:hypothetical protein
MAFDTRTLLDKKEINGDELGKAYLLNYFELHLNKKYLFSDEEITKLMSKLPQQEYEIFQRYRELHQWLLRYNPMSQTHYVQADNALTKLYFYLCNTINAEYLISERGENNKLDPIIQSISSFYKYETIPQIEGAHIDSVIEVYKESLSQIQCYNEAIKLLSSYLELPIMSNIFCRDLKILKYNNAEFNYRLKELKTILTGDKRERQRKKKLTQILFPYFDIDSFIPAESYVVKCRELLPYFFEKCSYHSIINSLQEQV